MHRMMTPAEQAAQAEKAAFLKRFPGWANTMATEAEQHLSDKLGGWPDPEPSRSDRGLYDDLG